MAKPTGALSNWAPAYREHVWVCFSGIEPESSGRGGRQEMWKIEGKVWEGHRENRMSGNGMGGRHVTEIDDLTSSATELVAVNGRLIFTRILPAMFGRTTQG
ncbi:Hypothetical protein NTJ_03089 [Nesidiocoris tenuis]|uniref:Uncharacterized protein n=1 Tax=Nesidiocoris tenuis TaxID=355587 RepID=A0ABN7ADC8_9HEMI|nr:Hypothetical protein NTJ_03089 [Nesidiocoris tenuis]